MPARAPAALPPPARAATFRTPIRRGSRAAAGAAAAGAAPASPTPAAGRRPVQPPGNGHAVSSADEITERLLAIVSERTGYPAEMLELDADLEGDLGIDSIKRVEIAGTLSQTVALPDGASLDVEELTASRTLREVIAVLEAVVASGRRRQPPVQSARSATLPAVTAAADPRVHGDAPF